MSVTFTTADPQPYWSVGAYGPLTEDDALYAVGEHRRLDPTVEQELAAGHGPNFANANASLVLAHLGIDHDPERVSGELAVSDLEGRCLTALAVGGNLSDDGFAATVDGGPGTGRATYVDCGQRAGYLTDAVTRLLALCRAARERGSDTIHYA